MPSKALISTADYMSEFGTAADLGVHLEDAEGDEVTDAVAELGEVNRRVLALAAAQSADITTRLSEVGVRLRPQLRFNRRISRGGLEVFATQEHFLNFNTTAWGQRAGYERMRNAVGLSIPLSKQVKTDIGYLNQYRFGRNGARDQMDHAATMALTLSL